MKYNEIIKKALNDPRYKENLLKNPEAVFRDEGFAIPNDVKVLVYENTDKEIYVVIPKKYTEELSDKNLQEIAGAGEWTPPGGWFPFDFD